MEHLLNKAKRFFETSNGKIAIAVLAILIVSGGGYYYWTGTPQYTLAQIKTAYETRDVNLAMKYINFDAVFDDQWSSIEAKISAQQSNTQNSWEAFGSMIGQGLVENMKPTLKEKMLSSLKDGIRNAATTSSIADVAQSYTITRSGDTVIVSGLGSIKFELRKEGQHYWQVVAVKGLTGQSLGQAQPSYLDSLNSDVIPHVGTALQDIQTSLALRTKYVKGEMLQLQDLAANGPTGPYRSPNESDKQDAANKLNDAQSEVDSGQKVLSSIQPAPSNMARLNELLTETLDSLGKTVTAMKNGDAPATVVKYLNQATDFMQQAADEKDRMPQTN
jgi:hypothetical protein